MSKQAQSKTVTIPSLVAMKGKQPIVTLTAYSAPMAELLDAEVDILLVGDSLGMVLYGMESTVSVPLEYMIAHGRAVASHASHACVVVDMPFGTYQESNAQAFASCARVMKETGCAAVKLEGGAEMAETVEFLSQRGVPVMAHIGLMPQRVHAHGGYRYQGRTQEECDHIKADAKALADAGAFALLIECVDADLGKEISEMVSIPTIGIGAGDACDGYVVVTEDMMGLFERTAGFVKRYGSLRDDVLSAVRSYAADVRGKKYPSDEYITRVKKK